jgi:LmbE family N-acetylglucosaminyl deacetylase
VIVISPHLDDAVFACGALLAAHPGSVVVTVFAGTPPDARHRHTVWDARSGFADAAQALAARRDEDRRALALLEARPLWLDFSDSQYGRSPTSEALAAALREALQGFASDTLLYPLGLFHCDHRLVHDACAAALPALPGLSPQLYEDALYRGLTGLLQQRLTELQQAGLCLTPARWPTGDAARKAAAVAAYASQLRALGPHGYADTTQPERCWRIEPSPHAAVLRDG